MFLYIYVYLIKNIYNTYIPLVLILIIPLFFPLTIYLSTYYLLYFWFPLSPFDWFSISLNQYSYRFFRFLFFLITFPYLSSLQLQTYFTIAHYTYILHPSFSSPVFYLKYYMPITYTWLYWILRFHIFIFIFRALLFLIKFF